ncbi:hypothetical protein GCM10017786_51210 [Amycolatopsis deserti]|uniref:Protein kinase domain-containing protein n=1 Tax=Amycolatopsis deserti TaxID=185696 RepID=A0ABQ3JBY2_9PSEU|nr:hypothetical protein [Amycolatopsis deserti]GHF11236.1 hypothetical protein GCM10017786_51210 [Amycolatopsis deserti]
MRQSLAARRARHGRVSAALSQLSASSLAALLAAARPLGTGIGGTTWLADVEGVPVFVKRVPVTEVELAHPRSTADLFGLPVWSHYGVGSPGGGAWRELAAHVLTSDDVLAGGSENFLLLHHWRILGSGARPAMTAAEREESIAFWHGHPGVRQRLEALGAAPADLVVFLEHMPHDLLTWMHEDACEMAERELTAIAGALSRVGLWHFDAHFGNTLTDGERLYLTDFGLASSPRFDLTGDERRFLADHATHDRSYVLTHLVNWIVRELGGISDVQWRNAAIRTGDLPALPPAAADVVRRHAPVAAVVNDFYFRLHTETRRAPYPRNVIEHLLD